jgi:four helix bundle protein
VISDQHSEEIRQETMDGGTDKRARSVEDLDVFRRAYAVSLEVHRASLSFPSEERFALSDQVRRASKSVCALIAEGYGRQRGSDADFKRYLVMALGSAEEMRLWLKYCSDLGYVEEAKAAAWRDEYHQLARMLQGFIGRLER